MRLRVVGLFLCGIFLVVFFWAAAAKDVFLERLLKDFVRNKTGCKIEMGSFAVNIPKTEVRVKDLIIFNPPGYEETVLLRAPEVYVDFSVFDYVKKKDIHLYTLLLDVQEYFFIRNEKGEVNGELLLSAFKTTKKTSAKEKQPPSSRPVKRVSMQIDKLTLRIGRIISKDYSKGTPPDVREFVFNIDETFDNVQDGYSLVEAVVGKEWTGSVFKRLFKSGIEKIIRPVTKAIEAVKEAGAETAAK